jgi:putative integral membrane protein (TIGR02587 family)
VIKNSGYTAESTAAHEVRDLVRAASGGFLLGVPMLYTMEIWWIGKSAEPAYLFAAIAFCFVPTVLLNRSSGFRTSKDRLFVDAIIDAFDALAISLLCVTIALFVIREIHPNLPLYATLGKIIYEATPFAIGVGLSGHYLLPTDTDSSQSASEGQENTGRNATLADIGSTAVGALVVSLSIAPTDEVPMISGNIDSRWLVVVILASLIVSYAIVFEAGFTAQSARKSDRGLLQNGLTETLVSYLVSLSVAALLLKFFGRLSFRDPWSLNVNHTIILGFPATIGGAAGRLAI